MEKLFIALKSFTFPIIITIDCLLALINGKKAVFRIRSGSDRIRIPDLGSWVPNPDLSNVYSIYQFRLSIQLSYVDS